MDQQQFLNVVDRDEAERRFRDVLSLSPLESEMLRLDEAWGRTLADDVVAQVDVPSFDRSNVDGFAVRAADTYDAEEQRPCRLQLLDQVLEAGVTPRATLAAGVSMSIATGGMLPRGADAVVMVEHTDSEGNRVVIRRSVSPGAHVAFAGTDISAGETVLRRGDILTSRETGVLAAIGVERVAVYRQPRVAILSTGNEIIAPGQPMRPGMVYDSNMRVLADAVREQGGDPVEFGVVRDELDALRQRVRAALEDCDVVLLSGGTSKGAGDLSYRVVREMKEPGIVAHGVALKPGKPLCLAAHRGKPVVVLPGFPTSAIFTFHEFVAPVIRQLAGRGAETQAAVTARMALQVNSEIGRTEYLLVGLAPIGEASLATASQLKLAAYPMGKGSGSVTTFSRADGFVVIDRHTEIVEAGVEVPVVLLNREAPVADLVVIGSHCVGLDVLLGRIQAQGFHVKFLAVGSTAGLEAAHTGQCDLAGLHLLDPGTGQYNRPFVKGDLRLIPGYRRMQGLLFRAGDHRFEGQPVEKAIENAVDDPSCAMVNRNRGSGTRILIDQLLSGRQPSGYAVQPRNHSAVAAAIVQQRADWGVAIQYVAEQAGLGFLPVTEEHYDFVVNRHHLSRPAVIAFQELLGDSQVRAQLEQRGLKV